MEITLALESLGIILSCCLVRHFEQNWINRTAEIEYVEWKSKNGKVQEPKIRLCAIVKCVKYSENTLNEKRI